MTRSVYSRPENTLLKDILAQTQQLGELIDFYFLGEGKNRLLELSVGGRILFCAQGMYLKLTDWAAQQCRLGGIDAQSVDIDEFSKWPENFYTKFDRLVFFSLDAPIIFNFDSSKTIVVSDQPEKWAEITGLVVFPLPNITVEAKPEASIIVGGILLWLIGRYFIGCVDGSEEKVLNRLRSRLQLLIDGREAIIQKWQDSLFGMDRLAFAGFEDQPLASSFTAELLFHWSKIQSLNLQSRQNLLEDSKSFGPGWAVVFFRSGENKSQTELLEQELGEKGVRCIQVINGFPEVLSNPSVPPRNQKADPAQELSQFLNLFSGQLLASTIKIYPLI